MICDEDHDISSWDASPRYNETRGRLFLTLGKWTHKTSLYGFYVLHIFNGNTQRCVENFAWLNPACCCLLFRIKDNRETALSSGSCTTLLLFAVPKNDQKSSVFLCVTYQNVNMLAGSWNTVDHYHPAFCDLSVWEILIHQMFNDLSVLILTNYISKPSSDKKVNVKSISRLW